MFDDPVPDPYPEFEEEMFELYFDSKLKIEDIKSKKGRDKYAAWLEKRQKALRDN